MCIRDSRKAKRALEEARDEVARCLNAEPGEIYFTSGGSEADNWAIKGAAHQLAKKGKRHIITTQFEHHAVLHTCAALEKEGFEVTYLQVHSNGLVRPEELKQALRDDTALVTVIDVYKRQPPRVQRAGSGRYRPRCPMINPPFTQPPSMPFLTNPALQITAARPPRHTGSRKRRCRA